MASLREFKESPWEQGTAEISPYDVVVPTSWGQDPSSPVATLYRVKPDGTLVDVSSTSLTGSTTVSGQTITTKSVTTLTLDYKYMLKVKFVVGTKTFEAFGYIHARN